MPRLSLIPRGTRRGVTNTGEFPVPAGSVAHIRMARLNWPARKLPGGRRAETHAETKQIEVVECDIEISFDGGQNWRYLAGFAAPGGDIFDRRGDLVVESSLLNIPLPEPQNPSRRVRGRINCKDALDVRLDLDIE